MEQMIYFRLQQVSHIESLPCCRNTRSSWRRTAAHWYESSWKATRDSKWYPHPISQLSAA